MNAPQMRRGRLAAPPFGLTPSSFLNFNADGVAEQASWARFRAAALGAVAVFVNDLPLTAELFGRDGDLLETWVSQ
jgi:hypothetical protein